MKAKSGSCGFVWADWYSKYGQDGRTQAYHSLQLVVVTVCGNLLNTGLWDYGF